MLGCGGEGVLIFLPGMHEMSELYEAGFDRNRIEKEAVARSWRSWSMRKHQARASRKLPRSQF